MAESALPAPPSTTEPEQRHSEAERVALLGALKRVLHTGLDPVFAIIPTGQIIYANDAYDALFAHRCPNGAVGMSILDIEPEKRELLEEMLAFNLSRTPDDETLVIESPTVHADGTNRWYEWRNLHEFDEDGNVVLIVGVSRDITARRIADLRLARSRARLEESNRDLLDFAQVASHDLQEPLRKVTAFADRLERKLEGQMDDQAADYMRRMNNAATRMQLLIDDLLTFARVQTRGAAMLPTDLHPVAQGVVTDLEIAVSESEATVRLEDLPTLPCDRSQMRQLFQNLIGNALKFRQPGVPPVITVSSTHHAAQDSTGPEGGWYEIRVSDNGIGFDEKYSKKIFTPFQRLHNRREYDGSGVGLSVCRRIAERHQGSIWAERNPDEGSTFVVRLPASQAVDDDIEHAQLEGMGVEHSVIDAKLDHLLEPPAGS